MPRPIQEGKVQGRQEKAGRRRMGIHWQDRAGHWLVENTISKKSMTLAGRNTLKKLGREMIGEMGQPSRGGI